MTKIFCDHCCKEIQKFKSAIVKDLATPIKVVNNSGNYERTEYFWHLCSKCLIELLNWMNS